MYKLKLIFIEFFSNNLIKNISVFLSGSILALLASALTQFLLPKLLSIEDYGFYKSFTLYLSFTSLFHFGLKDGIYMFLCSNKVSKIINSSFFTAIIIQQSMILIIMLLASFYITSFNNTVFICLSFTSFFLIINTYYDSLYQSKKKFKIVSVLKVLKEFVFLFYVLFVFLCLKITDFGYLLVAFLFSVFIVFLIYSISSRKHLSLTASINYNIIKPVYKRGFTQIVGNFGNQINTNVDKLFVNIFYPVKLFAVYSFGGMFFVLVNTLVNSITTVVLPYLFNLDKFNLKEKYKKLMLATQIISLFLFFYVIAVFYLIDNFYENYTKSISIISLFYVGMVYNLKINIVQNNFLKSLDMDKDYIRNNYISLLLFISTMIIMFLNNIDLMYFALCTSIMMYFRFRINLVIVNKKLGEKNNYIFHDILSFILGSFLYLYANNYVLS